MQTLTRQACDGTSVCTLSVVNTFSEKVHPLQSLLIEREADWGTGHKVICSAAESSEDVYDLHQHQEDEAHLINLVNSKLR